MIVRLFISCMCLCFSVVAIGQRITPEEYINTFKDAAIEEMKRSGVPASITLAQGLLETESGNSDLLHRSNNHFGIKCKSNWTGESVSHTDDAPNECFRKYPSARESYADHSNFLKANTRYAFLFTLQPKDYAGWARGLKKAGYATNPRYPDILIKNIEQFQLYKYDELGTGTMLAFDQPHMVDSTGTIENIKLKVAAPGLQEEETDFSVQEKKFNGLKAIFVSANTSLLAIATRAKIALNKLLDYNDLKADGLLAESQYIYLEKKVKEGKKETYTVTETASLYEVSQSTGVQLKYLADYNKIEDKALISAGTVLKLKP